MAAAVAATAVFVLSWALMAAIRIETPDVPDLSSELGALPSWFLREKSGRARASLLDMGGSDPVDLETPMPANLHGKNLVFYGDSNDRMATINLCKMYGEQMLSVHRNGKKLPQAEECNCNSNAHMCHLKDYNVSVLYFAHGGVLSVNDDSAPLDWHKQILRTFQDPRYLVDAVSKHRKEHVLQKLVKENLPERPIVLVTQSSLWDSVLAKDFLIANKRPLQMRQGGLELRGWSGKSGSVHAWGWPAKATEFMSYVKSMKRELPIERVVWRTNADCPEKPNLINEASEEQANVARKLVGEKKGPWHDVKLMDWRANLDARSHGWCDGIHYQRQGYKKYVETLWATLS